MWYCENCGKRNDSHSRFCTACGSPRQKGRAWGPVILVSVLAGVVLIAAALILTGVIPLERAVSSWPDTEEVAGVRIDGSMFPDPGFRAYLSKEFDADGDGILSGKERLSVTVLIPEGTSSLEGIAYFPNLIALECDNESITSLDLSGNPELQVLILDGAENLRSLNVQGCTKLRYVSVVSSGLTRIDFSGNPRLAAFNCNKNPQLAELNLSGCTELRLLAMANAPRLQSLDLRGCTALLRELKGSTAHIVGEFVGYAVDNFDYSAVSDLMEYMWFAIPEAGDGYGTDVMLLSERAPNLILPPAMTLPQLAPTFEPPVQAAPDTELAALPSESVLSAKVYRGYPSLNAKLQFAGASASSELKEGNILFEAGYALDSEKSSVQRPWVEGARGDGIGESLTLWFGGEQAVQALSLKLGYARDREHFLKNNRPSRLELSFSDGSSVVCSFDDTPDVQTVELDHYLFTSYVQITILDVYKGTQCQDTCIYSAEAFV